MQLILVIPGLPELRAGMTTSVRASALAHLLALAGAPTREAGGTAAALAARYGVDPAGGLAAGADPARRTRRRSRSGFWLAADPVTLAVGRSDVRLAGLVDDLDRAAADALVATLNAHFAGDGLAFVAPRPDAFFVRSATSTRLSTHPPHAALGRPLHRLLPEGVDADTWRRWQAEIEMLLHEHPVNVERERAGQAPANSVWFSCGGTMPRPPAPAVSIRTFAAAGIAAALAAHAGSPARALPGHLGTAREDAPGASAIVVALEPAIDIAALERAWAAPARDALARGAFDAVTLLAERQGGRRRLARAPPRVLAALRRPPPAARSRRAARRREQGLLMDIVRRAVPDAARSLAASGVHPVLARVFAARGVATPDELDHDLATLPPFATMKGIDDTARRLADAIARREKILIVADYDADGATACAVAVRGLAAMGAVVDFLVPNRFEYGYGLTPEIVAAAAAMTPRLIVTVDNGIASHDGVAAAAALGIDVLITDHHLPAATLPAPALIVNPNQPGCGFPGKHLAGVGVVFYVLLATRAELRTRGAFADRTEPNLGVLLDLVALGTVADVVRLDRINRTLVAQGLARIRAGRAQPGINALLAAASRDPRKATGYDLGFVAGPRLNAAGRLSDMALGIRCLLADSPATALPLATELDRLNRERRDVESTMQEEALAALDARAIDAGDADAYTLCLFHPDWHQGVVGIVAGRLKDRYHRPSIVFARGSGGELKGSGRSIAGFHLRDALDLAAKRAPGLVTRFGGHAFAAGLTLAESGLPRFAAIFEAIAREQLSPSDLARTLPSDGSLAAGELGVELAEILRAEVWGQGFPAPVFDDTFSVLAQRTVGGNHSKLALARGTERFDAILFRHADPLPRLIRAAYRPDVNEWRGKASLQLVIEHWQPA